MQRNISEFVGTATLATVVVGSGIMAQNLTTDVGLQLLINAAATGAILWLLIQLFAPISGAHFNPVVSLIALYRSELSIFQTLSFIFSQTLGAITGTVIANIFFSHAATEISSKSRDGANILFSEVIATAGLVFLIHRLLSMKSEEKIPAAVALWIFSAYFFTSSTSVANPAISIGRIFTESFAGIAPHSAFIFIPFQLLGGVLGYLLAIYFNPKYSNPQNSNQNSSHKKAGK